MSVKRDRPMRVLELLAEAGDPGMFTHEIVTEAGEIPSQRTLTWFGAVLRDGAKRGWTVQAGKSKGGWQQGQSIMWAITPAGRQHLLAVQARRDAKAREEKAETTLIRKRQAALRAAYKTFDKDTATLEQRREVTVTLRDAGVSWSVIADLTGKTHQTAINDYRAASRVWPSRIAPRVQTVPFTPRSGRFTVIAGVLAEETGLESWQAEGMLKVMHHLGFTVEIPAGFRFHPDEVKPVVVPDAGLEDDLRIIRKHNQGEVPCGC